jgi:hypothetical protein
VAVSAGARPARVSNGRALAGYRDAVAPGGEPLTNYAEDLYAGLEDEATRHRREAREHTAELLRGHPGA